MSAVLFDTLEQSSDTDLATAITRSYGEMEEAVALAQWKMAGVAAGHFVEAVRRFLELRVFGSYTPISKSLSGFNTQTLAKLESGSGDDSYRFHIPRALFALYGMRNKKGYGHLSLELASKVDVEFMAGTCRWVLAELVRINSGASIEETDRLVSQMTERRTPLIWVAGDAHRILETDLSLKDSSLLLLYHKRMMSVDDLARATEAKLGYLKRTLRKLHSERLIELNEDTLQCQISPSGSRVAEGLLRKHMQ
ncbi:hypothetical protein [Ruegeria profundi]|uniref:hypothetical protein n=1 Tax=Ruegeria profundi TaxID=1685378 RepID=UPI001CD19E6E|nr:hypothetical protein [Ruegeria profundi]MCA0930607.1 hypothetical protein [Ruegeria profundi]